MGHRDVNLLRTRYIVPAQQKDATQFWHYAGTQKPKQECKRINNDLAVVLSHGNNIKNPCLFVYTVYNAVFRVDTARPISGIFVL